MQGGSTPVSKETGAGLIFTEHLREKPDPKLFTVVRTLGNPPPGAAIPFPSPFSQHPPPWGPSLVSTSI